ncbi:MAG: hypothetical protein IPN94_14970 [Sphingobacteriales bacterium]|nr:hypothetical protein [Sphingobacteriales bacterium]
MPTQQIRQLVLHFGVKTETVKGSEIFSLLDTINFYFFVIRYIDNKSGVKRANKQIIVFMYHKEDKIGHNVYILWKKVRIIGLKFTKPPPGLCSKILKSSIIHYSFLFFGRFLLIVVLYGIAVWRGCGDVVKMPEKIVLEKRDTSNSLSYSKQVAQQVLDAIKMAII